jgi:hypothetical protein
VDPHGALYVGNDSSVYIYPEGNQYRGVIKYTIAYHGRPIENYTGTKKEMLDLMTARSTVRKMTAKELARIGASRKAQKGVQWKQALVELNRKGKGPDGKRKSKARAPHTALWNPTYKGYPFAKVQSRRTSESVRLYVVGFEGQDIQIRDMDDSAAEALGSGDRWRAYGLRKGWPLTDQHLDMSVFLVPRSQWGKAFGSRGRAALKKELAWLKRWG